MNANVIMVSGNLTKDPDCTTLQSGTEMAKFSIANNRKYKEKWVNFFNCVAWGGTAKIIKDYCKKGKPVEVIGELKQDRWETDAGEKRSSYSIMVKEIILGAKVQNTTVLDDGKDVTDTTGSFDEQEPIDDDLPF